MPYLAMTAAEFSRCPELPEKTAWMACHFSPAGSGLTNLPGSLPPGCLLILDDSTPIRSHDAGEIVSILAETVRHYDCCGVLLDFEQPAAVESMAMAKELLSLPCPVCLAAEYASPWECPVFLPPIPVLNTPEEHLTPWAGREIWLDCAPAAVTVTLTEKGSQTAPMPPGAMPDCPYFDEALLCHYRLDVRQDRAVFTLRRTKEDLIQLLEAARPYGVTRGVGLWQELG